MAQKGWTVMPTNLTPEQAEQLIAEAREYVRFQKPTNLLVDRLADALASAQQENTRLQERIGPIDPGGGDRIDELESAIEFLRHNLASAQQQLDEINLLRIGLHYAEQRIQELERAASPAPAAVEGTQEPGWLAKQFESAQQDVKGLERWLKGADDAD